MGLIECVMGPSDKSDKWDSGVIGHFFYHSIITQHKSVEWQLKAHE